MCHCECVEQTARAATFVKHITIFERNIAGCVGGRRPFGKPVRGKLSPTNKLQKFVNYYENNELSDPNIVASKIYYIMSNSSKFSNNLISLRDF